MLVREGKSLQEPLVEQEESPAERSLKSRAGLLIGFLVLVNVVCMIMLLLVTTKYPAILSPGILAFSFGLRHAVDADHIAAIDNVTRKLISEGQRPLTVGLWFSLGHSSVVVIMCIVVAAGSSYMREHMDNAKNVGAIIGTVVSGSVLFLIGAVNFYVCYKLTIRWRRLKFGAVPDEAGEKDDHDEHEHDGVPCTGHEEDEHDEDDGHTHLILVNDDAEVEGPGFLTKCCPTVFRAVDSPWKMYPIGFLFGLGFDTASEVALLGLSALTPKNGVPGALILILPLMFSCGMSLVDTLGTVCTHTYHRQHHDALMHSYTHTIDGIMMLWAYGWAMLHPARKLFYNLFLTGVSAFIAIAIGVIEVLGCIQVQSMVHGAHSRSRMHTLSLAFMQLHHLATHHPAPYHHAPHHPAPYHLAPCHHAPHHPAPHHPAPHHPCTLPSCAPLQTELNYNSPFWRMVGSVNDNFEYVGYSIIAFFVLRCVELQWLRRCQSYEHVGVKGALEECKFDSTNSHSLLALLSSTQRLYCHIDLQVLHRTEACPPSRPSTARGYFSEGAVTARSASVYYRGQEWRRRRKKHRQRNECRRGGTRAKASSRQ
jgi:high-affinity nickel-transport protein